MKMLTFIKKSAFILFIAPLLSLGTLYAVQSSDVARGEAAHHGAAATHHDAAAHHLDSRGALDRHELNRGLENRGAFNRGAEAGAIEGAGLGGAAVETPMYVTPTQPVQYVAPVPVAPSTVPATPTK